LLIICLQSSDQFTDAAVLSDLTLLKIDDKIEDKIESNQKFCIGVWSLLGGAYLLYFSLLFGPRFCCKCGSPHGWTITHNILALVYVITSITLIITTGVDSGLAKFTKTKQDSWHLLIASGLYLLHGFWAWSRLLKYIMVPSKLLKRWRQTRGRQIMDTVRVELQAYHANPQPVMPPPAVIPAPIHDGNDRGPIGNACTQAIRVGQVDAIKTLGILPTFIGPDVTLAHGQQDPGFVASMQDALYRAQGGDADQGIFGTGGLALEDQEKLWNWVLTLMGVAQATHFALYAFVSYIDVIRQLS
jgi:hypothetical protein